MEGLEGSGSDAADLPLDAAEEGDGVAASVQNSEGESEVGVAKAQINAQWETQTNEQEPRTAISA